MSMTSQAAKSLVRGFYDVLANGDLTLLDSTLSPEWSAVPALRSPGPEGWKASVTNLRSALSDIHVDITQMIVEGDMVAVLGTTTAIHSGMLLGVPATGAKVVFRSSDMHRIKDDRVVQTWHLEDYFGIAAQLGLKFSL